MGPLILFGIGRILYSLIERHDKWFVVEFIMSAVFIGGGLLLFEISENAIRGVSLGLLFIVTGLASRIILPRHPIEAMGKSTIEPKKIVSVGIIDFV